MVEIGASAQSVIGRERQRRAGVGGGCAAGRLRVRETGCGLQLPGRGRTGTDWDLGGTAALQVPGGFFTFCFPQCPSFRAAGPSADDQKANWPNQNTQKARMMMDNKRRPGERRSQTAKQPPRRIAALGGCQERSAGGGQGAFGWLAHLALAVAGKAHARTAFYPASLLRQRAGQSPTDQAASGMVARRLSPNAPLTLFLSAGNFA